jgi:hypothetical protein
MACAAPPLIMQLSTSLPFLDTLLLLALILHTLTAVGVQPLLPLQAPQDTAIRLPMRGRQRRDNHDSRGRPRAFLSKGGKRVPTTLLLHIPPSLAHDAHQALLVADETGARGHSYERTSSSHSPSAVIYLSRRPSAQHSWYSQVKQEFGTRLCSYNHYLAVSIPFIFTPQTVSQKSQRFFIVRATDMDDHLNSHPDNRRVDFYIFFLQRRL